MSSTPAKKAIIYVRLSSYLGETDTTTSPERQEEACRAYAASQGWEVIEVVSDLDVSGSDKGLRLDRPGLVRVRSLWQDADVLLFAKIDRLARNVLDWSRIREEADRVKCALVSVADGLDLTTPGGRFVATILQAFAEMEAAMISTRTKEAVAHLAREGRHRGGQPSYGWMAAPRSDGPGFRLVLDPLKAPILREAVDRVIGGESVTQIADDFNRRGIPGGQGNGWQNNTLRLLLRRPILRGYLTHHGEVMRGPDGLPLRPHEPLVTDAEWTSLQTAMEWGSPWRPADPNAPFTLLRGLVSCLICGKRLHAVTAADKFPQWSCSRRTVLPGTQERCPGTVISRPRLETYVVEEVLRRFGDMPGVEVIMEERADEEIAEVEEALDAVVARLRDADTDEDEEALLGQRRALRARLRDLQASPVTVEASERPTGRTFFQDWEAADDRGKSALLASVLAVVSISRGKRGVHALDPARVTLIFQPTATEARGSIQAGVVYRDV